MSRQLKPLAVASVVLSLAVAVIAGAITHAASFRQAENKAQDMARLIEEATRRSLVEAEVLLRAAVQDIGDVRTADFRENSPLVRALEGLHEGVDSVANIYVFRPDGSLAFMTDRYPPPSLNVSDRRYFQHLRAGGSRFIMGSVSRVTGKPGFVYARRLEHPDGGFGGVLMISFLAEQFVERLNQSDLGRDSVFGLFDFDGYLVVRHPIDPRLYDRNVGSAPVYAQLKAASAGLYTSWATAFDGKSRIIAWRKVGDYPLFALVGISVADVLLDWLGSAAILLAAAVPALLGSIWFARVALAKAAAEKAARNRLEDAVASRTRELRDSEKRLKEMADAMPQLVWTADARGQVDFYNRRAVQYGGLRQDGGHWTWSPSLHPDHLAATVAAWEHSVATGAPYEMEHMVATANGDYRWHISRAVAGFDDDGHVVRWYGTATDVHELKMAERRAERASESKSEFLAAASHDLRQPLQSMYLFLDILVAQVTSDTGQKSLALMQQSMNTLKLLLDSLLDVSRLDAAVVTPTVEDFPLAELMEEFEAMYRPVAATKGLRLEIRDVSGTVVRSDRVLLGRLLRNLVENALRYTSEGEVMVSSRRDGDHQVIEVADTGIGIAPENMENIFEVFYQVGNPSRDRGQGLGLGLAIVDRLAKVLGHQVAVRSSQGVGSTFSVRVPLAGP